MIYISKNDKGHWSVKLLGDFGEAPCAVIKDGDCSALVVTSKRLIKINTATKKTEILIDNAFWDGLYPNSIATSPSGACYIGMRHGIAKLEKKDGNYCVSWLLPTKKFAEQLFLEKFN